LTLGYINLPALAALVAGRLATVRLGVTVAHWLPRGFWQGYSRCFWSLTSFVLGVDVKRAVGRRRDGSPRRPAGQPLSAPLLRAGLYRTASGSGTEIPQDDGSTDVVEARQRGQTFDRAGFKFGGGSSIHVARSQSVSLVRCISSLIVQSGIVSSIARPRQSRLLTEALATNEADASRATATR
jgi:hypothetical protein